MDKTLYVRLYGKQMPLEIIVIIISIIIAGISGWTAIFSEKSRKKRYAAICTTILAIVSLIVGIEISLRNQHISDLEKETPKNWLLLLERPIEAVEFEIFGSNAAIHYDKELLDFLKGISFESDSDILAFRFPDGVKKKFIMSEVFSEDNIRRYGTVGSALTSISVKRNRKKSDLRKLNRKDLLSVHRVDTLRSNQISRGWISSIGKENWIPAFGSLSVSLPLQNTKLKLKDLENIESFTIKNSSTSKVEYLGNEFGKFILSIRCILRLHNEILPTMVEISPQQYLKRGKSDGYKGDFTISGLTLLEIGRRNYNESLGYRDVNRIKLGSGILGLFSKHSKMNSVKFVGSVWASTNRIDESTLIEAVKFDDNHSCMIFEAKEWCGYGGSDICWYRYLIFEK